MFMNMKITSLFFVGMMWLSIAAPATCEDIVAAEMSSMKQSLDDKAAALEAAPAGVFDVEYVDGQIVRLKIKGEANVPTSMRGSRGDRFAREKANRDARAAFTKFLGENVVFSESEEEGVTIQEKNGEETSETMIVSTRLYSSNSAAMLKGLIVLMDHLEGEGAGRTGMVVLGWSKKLVDAADTARSDMSRGKTGDSKKSDSSSGRTGTPAGNSKTVTRIGNVDDF